MRLKTAVRLIKETIAEANQDNIPLFAAALAYYTVFSLAPVLVIAIAIVGVVFGEEAARGEIGRQMQGLLGVQGAEFVQSMI
jgi:membrane protein